MTLDMRQDDCGTVVGNFGLWNGRYFGGHS